MRVAICVLILACGCARAPLKTPDQAMRPSARMPSLQDDLGLPHLIEALEANVKFLKAQKNPPAQMNFGPRVVPRDVYVKSLEWLLAEAKADESGERLRGALSTKFEPFEVYGDEQWGQIFMTSYFEPEVEGSLTKQGRFTRPIYATPKDMVTIDVNTFQQARPGALEQRSQQNVLRGRLLASADPKAVPKVVAYPERRVIDTQGAESKILVWLDPIDAFFLEIQGSGVVKLKKGQMNIGYAAQNGHVYVPIGKFLLESIPKEKMTMHAIESHLRSLPPEQAREVMWRNPSYIFFQKLTSAGLTYLGTEVVAGRTIATDQSLFPKGALAFLEFEKPVFASPQDVEPQSWQPTSRFVIDQDTGGAIRGPHRVDLFWGRGAAAKQAAGVIKNKGRLIYFVPKLPFAG